MLEVELQVKVEDTRSASSIGWAYFRLPPFSPVAIKILRLLNEENDHAEELSRLIASDQAFASAVLTIANSALYAHCFPVTDILRAIHRIGQRKLQGLCMSVAMMTLLSKQAHSSTVRNLWAHNLACGHIAEMLAAGAGVNHSSAFTCGLLHDIGRLAMCVLQPKKYGRILESHHGMPVSMLQHEMDLFGFDHCDAGCELVRSLMLPTLFDRVIKSHHWPARSGGEWGLGDLVAASCRIADSVGFSAFRGCEGTPYAELICELPAKLQARLDPEVEVVALEIRGLIKMLRIV